MRRPGPLSFPSVVRPAALLLAALLTSACTNEQSAFVSAGQETAEVMQLFWIMTAGGTVIWLIVIGIALYASVGNPGRHPEGKVKLLLIGGGIVFPAVVLAALMSYGLVLLAADPPPAQHQLTVQGERWWWRVDYQLPGHGPVPVANEIALPLGEAVRFELKSDNVIHSLWIPSLAGKRDLIPGRTNTLVIKAQKLGLFRGQCAEYCGTSHAHMSLYAEVMTPDDYRRWLQHQASPARPPEDPLAQRGEALFMSTGCATCHQIRGTGARGSVGPDLTHVGSRHTIAGARLPRSRESFRQWIAHTRAIKPDAQMPAFPLPAAELDALAAYLDQLK